VGKIPPLPIILLPIGGLRPPPSVVVPTAMFPVPAGPRILQPKGKRHTLDIAPLGEGASLQKRSGMARVVEDFTQFYMHSLAFIHEWNAFAFPATAGPHLPTPRLNYTNCRLSITSNHAGLFRIVPLQFRHEALVRQLVLFTALCELSTLLT